MLYVTTRNNNDAFTAARAMNLDRAGDGGLFIPFHLNQFSRHEVAALAEKSFGQNVADILNLFFSTKLTGWDVDMTIGRNPVRHKSMNYRIVVSELWHNSDRRFSRMVNTLAERIHPDGQIIGAPSNWVQTAIRIAVLFGIFGQLQSSGEVRVDTPVDIAIPTGSFAWPMAAWYARKMGLPVGTIICGCNENRGVWELLHRGQMDTGALSVSTNTPEDDYAIPPDLERLISETCGHSEAGNFFWSCTEGGVYMPSELTWQAIRQGMFAAVVSQDRVDSIIPSVYRTNRYILDPYGALTYGALADYRARFGSSRMVLMLCADSPLCSSETVCRTMRMGVDELKQCISEM